MLGEWERGWQSLSNALMRLVDFIAGKAEFASGGRGGAGDEGEGGWAQGSACLEVGAGGRPVVVWG